MPNTETEHNTNANPKPNTNITKIETSISFKTEANNNSNSNADNNTITITSTERYNREDQSPNSQSQQNARLAYLPSIIQTFPVHNWAWRGCNHGHPSARSYGDDDAFVLRARIALKAGDEITISYLQDEDLLKSTTVRQTWC